MKSDGEIMEILAAYDRTGSFRAAAELTGCSHHTVAKHVRARDAGTPVPENQPRAKLTDAFRKKIEELVAETRGKVRADKVHETLTSMGFTGSERSTRRTVAEVKAAYRLGHQRNHAPWVSEPGLWLQYDFGDGPIVGGVKTVLFVAWLAWSRFRVVIALPDRQAPSVFAALDRTFRLLGGAPTYVLTDNEKTVTTMHIAGIPVRNRAAVTFARYYALSVLTCEPRDPATKGGVENAVKIAKADLVPTEVNLRGQYACFEELEQACERFMAEVNQKKHRATGQAPMDRLTATEQALLHPVPSEPFTLALGQSRKVPVNTSIITYENARYSVPERLLGQTVWVRTVGVGAQATVVIVHQDVDGPVQVASHRKVGAGMLVVESGHFSADRHAKVPGFKDPKPRTRAERDFCRIGAGAEAWLVEAASVGTDRITVKMAEAVSLAKLHGRNVVDRALGLAATHHRFGYEDLRSILASGHRTDAGAHQATEQKSLTQGTRSWADFRSTEPKEGQ